jgi:signal transduction histidine kinase
VKVSHEPVHLATEIENVLKSRLGSEDRDVFVASSLHHIAMADPVRVRQILRNLLTNALRYGGPEITITTHRDGPEVTLVLSDNGDGIPPEHRKRIFDPYHRGQKGLSRSDSVGLGLAVSRQLARLMDGDLTLRTDLGPATFQLTLPLAPKDPEAEVGPSPDAVVVG